MCNASSGDVSGSVGGVDSGGVVSCYAVADADSGGMSGALESSLGTGVILG